MTSLLRRTVVLSFSRFANQALVLLSPLLLVRILSVGEYGGYREFMLYAGLAASFVLLGIPNSLVYFLPKEPEREKTWVSQTALFVLSTSTIAVVVIYMLGDLIVANTSFDFVTVLQLYILFSINLDFVEYYWIAKKQSQKVLFYSTGRLSARIVVVIVVAFATGDARAIVTSLVVLEGLRFLLVLMYGKSRSWFTSDISLSTLEYQIRYFLPLGLGGLVEVLNTRAGMLFVSIVLGAESLAFYAIGAFATQIVNILRGSIADVIFPEIVELRQENKKVSLPLWQRATVWYCVLLFPVGVLFAYYADVIVNVLFTAEYAQAVPVFSTFAILLFVYCFDFHLPLRVQNANRYFFAGSIMALITNLALLYPAYKMFGLVGPVSALLMAKLVSTVFLGYWVMRVYDVTLAELVRWALVRKILLAIIVCLPILVLGKYIVEDLLIRGLVFGSLYLLSYLIMLRWLGVWDAFRWVRSQLDSSVEESI